MELNNLSRHLSGGALAAFLLNSCTSEQDFIEEDIGVIVSPPQNISAPKPKKCENSFLEDQQYQNEVNLYSERWDLPKGWSKWMLEEGYERLCNTFNITKFYDEHVTLGVYDNDLSIYKDQSKSGQDYAGLLEKLLELSHPGWEWKLTYLGVYEGKLTVSIDDYDGFVLLGSESSHANSKAIQVHHPGAIVHEAGHFLGLHHHYKKIEDVGLGHNMPPGEEKCIMDRNSQQWGSSERFALDLRMDVNNYEEINLVLEKVNGVLVDSY